MKERTRASGWRDVSRDVLFPRDDRPRALADAAAAAPRPHRPRGGGEARAGSRARVARPRRFPTETTCGTRPSIENPAGVRACRRSTRARRPIDRNVVEARFGEESERTWVLRLPARMARAGPAAPTAFTAVTRLAAAKPARRERRRALIVDSAMRKVYRHRREYLLASSLLGYSHFPVLLLTG
jgi:hypothetical protein